MIFAGVLLLGALHFFAPVCTSQVMLFNKAGDEILKPMACAQTSQTAQILAYLLIAMGFDTLLHARIRVSAILIGIILFLIPSQHGSSFCATGLCRMPMQCHNTAIWIKAIAILPIISGSLNFWNREK